VALVCVCLCGAHRSPSSCVCDSDAELAAAAADASAEAERATKDVDDLAAAVADRDDRGHDVADDASGDDEGHKTIDDGRGNMSHPFTQTDAPALGRKRQRSEGQAREDDGAVQLGANQTTS
jgi:hypothetical protein